MTEPPSSVEHIQSVKTLPVVHKSLIPLLSFPPLYQGRVTLSRHGTPSNLSWALRLWCRFSLFLSWSSVERLEVPFTIFLHSFDLSLFGSVPHFLVSLPGTCSKVHTRRRTHEMFLAVLSRPFSPFESRHLSSFLSGPLFRSYTFRPSARYFLRLLTQGSEDRRYW